MKVIFVRGDVRQKIIQQGTFYLTIAYIFIFVIRPKMKPNIDFVFSYPGEGGVFYLYLQKAFCWTIVEWTYLHVLMTVIAGTMSIIPIFLYLILNQIRIFITEGLFFIDFHEISHETLLKSTKINNLSLN